MSWTQGQFLSALAAEWFARAPRSVATSPHIDIENPGGMPAVGIAHRDVRRLSFAGASQRGDSSLVLQEVADLFKSFTASVADTDGESFEDFLAVSCGQWWWGAFEVGTNPTSPGNVVLRWLEPAGGNHMAYATVSTTPGASAALTADAILAALETMVYSTAGSRKVVNGLGSAFHAWVATGGSGSVPTVLIAANTHRQTFAQISTTLSGVTASYAYGESGGALLSNKIRDLRQPWTSAMLSAAGEVATVPATNAAGATVQVIPAREDVDLQTVQFRSPTGSKQLTSSKISHAEVIAPAVMRTAVIEINHSDFLTGGGSGVLIRSIALPFPTLDRLGFAYQAEGPPVIVDAYIEHHTPFQVDSAGAQSGTYPSVVMDVGISNPVLPDGGTRRLSGSALLRRQRLTTNATTGHPRQAGLDLNIMYPGASVHSGAVVSVLADGASEYVQWADAANNPTTDYHSGSGAIPSYLSWPERFVVTGISVELPSATAYTYASANHIQFALKVCPAGANPSSGWVGINTYLDLSSEPYATGISAAGVLSPGTLGVSATYTELCGFAVPKNWKLAILAIATGTVTTRGWTVRVHGYIDRGKGAALQSPNSSLAPDVWSDRADTLTADLLFEAKTEMGITEPGGTTYAMASLDQGKCFLHVHYWQPRRAAAAQAMTYAASNP